MNIFTYIQAADSAVIKELAGWTQKIEEYVNQFYGGNAQNTQRTKFGDCIAKVREIRERTIAEPVLFRGVRDINGRLQAGAIVTEEAGNIYQYESGCEYLYLDAISNAPWNVIETQQPESIKGAGTWLLTGIVQESIDLQYNGIVKIQSIARAKQFYLQAGFVENPDGSGEMVLTETVAKEFLETQQLRRQQLD